MSLVSKQAPALPTRHVVIITLISKQAFHAIYMPEYVMF